MIIEAFKRLYTGDDALQNHLILFVMTGFIMMLSKIMNMYSTPPLVNEAPAWLLFAIMLLMPVVALYMAGYMYMVNHRAYDDSTPELLPDFTLDGFKVFIKFLPLALSWAVIGIAIVALFNALILFATTSKAVFIVWQVLYKICGAFYILIIPFVLARFCENYDRKGLYNPLLPIKDLFKSAKEIGLLILKLVPVGIVLLTLMVLSAPYDITGFLFTAVFAYFFTLIQYVINYCYVCIYREKISKE